MRSKIVACLSLALLAVGVACIYDPRPKDGQEACSLNGGLCPDGYSCVDGRCYSAGHAPVTGGTGGAVTRTGGSTNRGGNSGAGGTGGVIAVGGFGAGGLTGLAGKPITGSTTLAGGGITTGGGVSTGGATGTGGATTCTPGKASGRYAVVDDIADGDTAIISQDGRMGGWYTYGDNTGVISMTPSPGQICASGSGFTNWGAGIGVNLDSVPTKTCTYDASVYTGVIFELNTSTITNGVLRFSVQTAEISSASSGGTCVSTSSLTDNCNDVYGVDLSRSDTGMNCQSALLSWSCGQATGAGAPLKVKVPFSYMSQQGWGQVFSPFNPKIIQGFQWQFKTCTATTCSTLPTSFNVCVGPVSFY